ncbi:MAG TPA: phenylalanine--tRNA ligase beta subunit-related protein [Vicinamibacterales bacterium]|nr:phenylalanine--tRNA ligase beta subunit-related protein [Vicinamibacterales bacterium]
MTVPFAVESALAPVVRPGVLWWDGATVANGSPVLDAEIAPVTAAVLAAPPADTQSVREMYRRIGLDPTKTRPSNEALLRRVRRGDPFPRVNSLVDAVNLCSLECQLPYGVYDRAALSGGLVLRLGRDEEAYAGIRKDIVHVAGRVTVADAAGPFGNPTSDSARAMVTIDTRDALVVVYAPTATAPAELTRVLDLTARRIAAACGGAERGRWTA